MPLPSLFKAASAAALLAAGGCANTGGVSSAGDTQGSVSRALCAMGFSAVPMRALASGHHIAQVTVNGRPGTFVVDTGAGATVIHNPYASAFALAEGRVVQGGRAVGTGGAQGLTQYAGGDLRIGGNRTALATLYGTDLGQVVKFLDPIAGGPVHGVIGQDIMRAQHAIVDVAQSRLYLRPVAGETARCG